MLAIALDQGATPATAPATGALLATFHGSALIAAAGVAFNVAYFVAIVVSIWFITRLGKRGYLTASLTGFACGSIFCAFAPSAEVFFVGRVIQGASAGGFFTSGLLTLVGTAPKSDLPLVMTLFSAVMLGAPSVAPLYAGLLLDHATWRELFGWLSLPAILAAVSTAVWMRDVEPGRAQAFDTIGFLALLLGTAAFHVLTSANVTLPVAFGAAALAACAVVLFARRELHFARVPFCDLRVLSTGSIARGLIVGTLLGVLFEGAVFETQFVAQTLHAGAAELGVLMAQRLAGVVAGIALLTLLSARNVSATSLMTGGLMVFAFACVAQATAIATEAGIGVHALLGIVETGALAVVLGPLAAMLFGTVERSQFASLVVLFKLSALVGAALAFGLAAPLLATSGHAHVDIEIAYAGLWCTVALVAFGTALLAATVAPAPAAK